MRMPSAVFRTQNKKEAIIMLKKKRTWDLIGIALGVVLILVGIVFAAKLPH